VPGKPKHYTPEFKEQAVKKVVESARTALAREAFREKPAKIATKDKAGARDVAIWLSVIDYLRANPTEAVYFVTSNVKDFGGGTAYEIPMLEDLGDMAPRLSYLTSFDKCISRFSAMTNVDLQGVKGLLSHLVGAPLRPIVRAAHISLSGGRYEGTRMDGSFEPFHWTAWIIPPSVIVRDVTEASGHRIGDEEWYTAAVDWILVGLTQPVSPVYGSVDISAIMPTARQWHTKILFSTGQDRKLAIVDFETPKAFNPNDRSELEPLIAQAMTPVSSSSSLLGAYFASFLDSTVGLDVRPDIFFSNVDPDQSPDLLSDRLPALSYGRWPTGEGWACMSGGVERAGRPSPSGPVATARLGNASSRWSRTERAG
jgi:hypothetical protein